MNLSVPWPISLVEAPCSADLLDPFVDRAFEPHDIVRAEIGGKDVSTRMNIYTMNMRACHARMRDFAVKFGFEDVQRGVVDEGTILVDLAQSDTAVVLLTILQTTSA